MMTLTSERRLTIDIRVWREHYLRDFDLSNYEEINQGLCEAFAHHILKLNPDANMYGFEEFEKPDGQYDWELMAEFGSKPPEGFTEQQVWDINPGGHLWIILNNRHYDAECPDGVDNFFELPFFQRQLKKKEKLRELYREHETVIKEMDDLTLQLHMDHHRSMKRLEVWNTIGSGLLYGVMVLVVGLMLYGLFKG